MVETRCEWCKRWVPEELVVIVWPGIPVCKPCYRQQEYEAQVRWGW